MGMSDLIIREQEHNETTDRILVEVGLLVECDIDGERYDALSGDDRAFEAALQKGVTREEVEARLAQHGSECSACAARDHHG